jgi:4-hydroxybenzoate polyprenyltransferase
MKAYLEAMRLERWPRSAAILVGSAAFFLLNPESFAQKPPVSIAIQLLLSFLLTWGISTANYIVNEIADAPFDIHHPTKRMRPLARKEIHRGPLLAAGAVLTLACLLTAGLAFPPAFFPALLALLIAGFIYNIKPVRTKDIPFLDSISESANNPIRFLIGWFAVADTALWPPVTLLVSWWAFGNFLMVAKRLSEFRLLKERAADYRLSLGRYSRFSLVMGMAVSALVFFVSYLVFAAGSGRTSLLILALPLLLYFLFFFKKTLREREVMEEPERLLKQPLFAAFTFLLLLGFLLALLFDSTGG